MASFVRRWLLASVCALVLIAPVVPSAQTVGEGVARATLTNGLRVVVVRDPLAPAVETVVNYLVGSDEAPQGFPGTAHAQEHMMFRGSKDLSTAQLADTLALLGGRFDADTQQSITQYYSTVPVACLGTILRLEATRMSGVLDNQSEWDQERKAIEQEVARDLSSALYRYNVSALSDLFAGTPYAHDALGTKSSFDQTTGAMLKSFHDAWYAPNNAVVVIVGDVDPQATVALVQATFGEVPARALPARPDFHLGAVTPKTITLSSDGALPYIIMSFRSPGYDSPEIEATQIAADVMNNPRGPLYTLQAEGKVLGGGVSLDVLARAGSVDAYLVTRPGADSKATTALLATNARGST